MNSKLLQNPRENLIVSTTIVFLSLTGILIPYSLLFGWNLQTGFLFWFILVPLISIFGSRFYSKVNKRIIPGIVGCIIFYLFMIFMIYSHYESDLFKLMILSSFSSIFFSWFLNKIFMLKEFA